MRIAATVSDFTIGECVSEFLSQCSVVPTHSAPAHSLSHSMNLELDDDQAEMLRRALGFWIGSAQRKRDSTMNLSRAAEVTRVGLSKRQAADMHYILKYLPKQLATAQELFDSIGEQMDHEGS